MGAGLRPEECDDLALRGVVREEEGCSGGGADSFHARFRVVMGAREQRHTQLRAVNGAEEERVTYVWLALRTCWKGPLPSL